MSNVKVLILLFGFLCVSAFINCEDARNEDIDDSKQNGTLTLKFATYCMTPNEERGLCVEVEKCPAFAKMEMSPLHPSYDFFIASNCTPIRAKMSKICCGKKVNFDSQTPKTQNGIENELETDLNPLPSECGKQKLLSFGKRIFGGNEASLGEFPWMARLIHRDRRGNLEYGCSAFLVHQRFAITAAHCMNNKLLRILGPIYQIVLGDHDSSMPIDCIRPGSKRCAPPPQRILVGKPIVYSGYDTETGNHNNDIAMIQLKTSAEFTDFVAPICLPDSRGEGDLFTVSGWGRTETMEASDVKQKVDLDRYPLDRCVEVYKEKGVMLNKKNQLCAGGLRNMDTCTGDSGGPLMIVQNYTWYAEGLVSFGIGCGEEGVPGVYTNIPRYLDWIKKTIVKKLERARTKSAHFSLKKITRD